MASTIIRLGVTDVTTRESQTREPSRGGGWQVVGYDTFGAGSTPDRPGSAWYEIGSFSSERAAMSAAAAAVKSHWSAGQIRDEIFVIQPDGVRCRCVLDSCPECGVGNTDCVKKPAMISGGTKYVCRHCGKEMWRSVGKVAIIVKRSWIRSLLRPEWSTVP